LCETVDGLMKGAGFTHGGFYNHFAFRAPQFGQPVVSNGRAGTGFERTRIGLQAASERTNPAESLGSLADHSEPLMQAESGQHKNFGQPVVSKNPAVRDEDAHDGLLTPAQAAARFRIPQYLLRKACSEGRLEHLRVINTLWLSPTAVAAFARSWQAQRRTDSV
jgi:hypothetical protein